MENFENSKKVIEKYGIDASYLGEDETGKFVVVPTQCSGDYIEAQSDLDNDDLFEKKYHIKLTGKVSSFPFEQESKVIIFKLYYK